MKTNYLTAVTLGLLTALSGCQAEDDAAHTPQGTIPIGFSGDVSETRAAGYGSAADLTAIGVFAYFTNGAFSESSSTPNSMYNQQVERQAGGSWTYSPVKYWPGNATEKLSFFAYAPYVDETVSGGSNPSFSGNTDSGYPVLTYTVPVAEADQTDLLASVPLINQTYEGTSGSVKFAMKHALTKVTLKVKSGDKYAKEITSLSVTAATGGELHFKDGGFEWNNITGGHAYTPAPTTNLTFAATDAGRDVATFFFLPTPTVTATFSITYKVKTTVGTEVLTKTITDQALPASPLWEAGTSLVYTFNLSEETVTVTVDADNSGSWASEGSEEKTVKHYTADELKPGDYYYSDGTTSDGGLRKSITTNDGVSGGQTSDMLEGDTYERVDVGPNTSKTCIGIVFYVGAGPGDNVADYDGSLTKIDGYVTALRDAANNIRWGPTGGTEGLEYVYPKTDIKFNGYANTKKVKALSNFSSYPAFQRAVNYSAGTGVALPSTASSWYLPSIAQLRSLNSATYSESSNQKIIGINLGKCGGSQFRLQRYWSSCPYSSTIALYVGFAASDMNLNANKTTTSIYHARSILTFQRVTP